MDPAPVPVLVGWLMLHLGALAAAWGTRVAAGSRLEAPLQSACFLAMAAVGTSAWIGRQHESGLWIASGITIVVMVLTAVIDFRRTHDIHPALQSSPHS